ncbi:MAG: DUF2339 domain-containing protein [Candidatus Paceibacterota bacterium]
MFELLYILSYFFNPMSFLGVIGVIVLIVITVRLSHRVSTLEDKVKMLSGGVSKKEETQQTFREPADAPGKVAPVQESGSPYSPEPKPITSAMRNTIDPSEAREPTAAELFGQWLKRDWLLKLGILLVLIGMASFVTYAFLNDWIGPVGRITFGMVLGAAILAFGFWRMQTYVHQGGAFLVLGSTTLIITIFSGFIVYGFFSPVSLALALVFVSAAFVAAASVQHRVYALAVSSLILASVAPILVFLSAALGGTDITSAIPLEIGIYAYLMAVVLGSVWVTALTGWRSLNTMAAIILFLYSLPLWEYGGIHEQALLVFAFVFGAIFFITNTAGIIKKHDQSIAAPLTTAIINALFLVIWIFDVVPDHFQSLIIAAWMLVYVVGAFLVFRVTDRRSPFYVYGMVGVGLLALATGVELGHSPTALMIAYTIESALVPVVVYTVTRNFRVAKSLTLLFIGPIVLSFSAIGSFSRQATVFNEHFIALVVLAGVLASSGFILYRHHQSNPDESTAKYAMAWLVISSIYVFVLTWMSLHIALTVGYIATMLSLVVYTVAGLVAYTVGGVKEQVSLRIYGGVLLIFVVGRLLLVDVWSMDITGKIITFVLVGLLLMSTAFIGRTSKKAGESGAPADEPTY